MQTVRSEAGKHLEKREDVQVQRVAVLVERIDEVCAMNGDSKRHVAQP